MRRTLTLAAVAVVVAAAAALALFLNGARAAAVRLPDGFVIREKGKTQAYIVSAGKKSPILGAMLDRWLNEAHYIKHDIIIGVTAAQIASYPDANYRNRIAMGKIAVGPGGKRYFIDDLLRKRPISQEV